MTTVTGGGIDRLATIIVDHLNSGRRTRRLVSRYAVAKPANIEKGNGEDIVDEQPNDETLL